MARPARRRVNGDGSLTKRADGRWMGRYYAWTSAGTRKRITIYGRTRQQAADKMREAQERNPTARASPSRTGPGSSVTGSTTGWSMSWPRTTGPPRRRCMRSLSGFT